MPKLGRMVKEFKNPNMKICGMGYVQRYGFFACVCNNKSRRHSAVYINDVAKPILDDYDDTNPCPSSNETIGNTYAEGNYVGFVGENGNVWVYDGVSMTPLFKTRFANAMTKHNGKVVMLDADEGKINIRLCYDPFSMAPAGVNIGTMPGDGIPMSVCSHKGKLYAAVADGNSGQGLACDDGSLIERPGCQCVVEFADELVYTSMNEVYVKNIGLLTTLSCEKIMDTKVVGNHLYVAGANPDSAWVINSRGEIALIGVVSHGNRKVGGSCFRVRIAVNHKETKGYFGRTVNGDDADNAYAEIYEMLWL